MHHFNTLLQHLTPEHQNRANTPEIILKHNLWETQLHIWHFNKCRSMRCWHSLSSVARFVSFSTKELVSPSRLFWCYYENSTCSLWLWHCFQGGCLLWCARTGNVCGEEMPERERERKRKDSEGGKARGRGFSRQKERRKRNRCMVEGEMKT